MISLCEIDPTSVADAEAYLQLLRSAHQDPDIVAYLPEIFDEGSVEQVRAGASRSRRDFIIVEDKIAGRIEYSEELNRDPSVIDKFPAVTKLGMNACYFLSSEIVSRNSDQAHLRAATKIVQRAFAIQSDPDASPWLPVAPVDDPSRGWLAIPDNQLFSIKVAPAITGWLPQYGIAEQAFHAAHAERAPQAS